MAFGHAVCGCLGARCAAQAAPVRQHVPVQRREAPLHHHCRTGSSPPSQPDSRQWDNHTLVWRPPQLCIRIRPACAFKVISKLWPVAIAGPGCCPEESQALTSTLQGRHADHAVQKLQGNARAARYLVFDTPASKKQAEGVRPSLGTMSSHLWVPLQCRCRQQLREASSTASG